MGTNSGELLRMLEPAVRPVPGADTGSAPGRTPMEDRSFESLLVEARSAAEVGGVSEAEPKQADPLSPLSGLDAIESASLRQLIAGRRGGV